MYMLLSIDLWGCFGFDEIEPNVRARVEELPGLVKRQKTISAVTNATSVDFGQLQAA